MNPARVRLGTHVKEAMDAGKPLVALESTIISHGMPYPTSLETAMEVEETILREGAVPATIGIVNGEVVCGLSTTEVRQFATSSEIAKATERDIAIAVARRVSAATTVGASLSIAASLGIRVLVTGGIGGVAKDAGMTLDISADLVALAQYRCVVVCSGTKAFMDIPATLEYFETNRVLVVGFQSEYFPMFWSRSSGHKVDWLVTDEGEVAEVFASKVRSGQSGSLFVGVPIPDKEALPKTETERLVALATAEVKRRGLTGKGVTPEVLRIIDRDSQGRALKANVALIKNNAAVGARIAAALEKPV